MSQEFTTIPSHVTYQEAMSTSQFRDKSRSGCRVANAASMAVVDDVLTSDDEESLPRPLFRFGLEGPMMRLLSYDLSIPVDYWFQSQASCSYCCRVDWLLWRKVRVPHEYGVAFDRPGSVNEKLLMPKPGKFKNLANVKFRDAEFKNNSCRPARIVTSA